MPDFKGRLIAFDVETGGFSSEKNPLCDIALVAFDPFTDSILDTYQGFIKPYMPSQAYTGGAMKVNGLSLPFLEQNGKDIAVVMKEVSDFIRNNEVKVPRRTIKPQLVGHNVEFDLGFLEANMTRCGLDLYDIIHPIIHCTMLQMQIGFPRAEMIANHKLGTCTEYFGIELEDAHSALPDTIATAKLAMALMFNRDKVTSNTSDDSEQKGRKFCKRFRF